MVMRVIALVVLVVGAVALIMLAVGPGLSLSHEASVWFLRINSAHAALLVLVGVATLIAAQRHGSLLWWSFLLCAGFVVLFLYGTAQSTSQKSSTWLWLDPAENFLHAALALGSFVVLVGAAAVPWWRRRRSEAFLGATASSPPEDTQG